MDSHKMRLCQEDVLAFRLDTHAIIIAMSVQMMRRYLENFIPGGKNKKH